MRNYSILILIFNLLLTIFVHISSFNIRHHELKNTFTRNQRIRKDLVSTSNHQAFGNKIFTNRRYNNLSMSTAVLGRPNRSSNQSSSDSFHQRMRNIVVNPQKKKRNIGQVRPDNLFVANTLEDYKLLVGDETDKIVVVRFFATWCKACQAIGPSFYRLAKQHKELKFVEVPVTERNVVLHQGLGVPSLPFAHIYHPNGGLVEEMRINKKYFKDFEITVQNYVNGACDLSDHESILE